ncbi:hypothetical protein CORC01_01753 [Colletotrichum orchidophilum]|uniref:Uncharacterized protein n=1 Tax=Colletotrichum orchidophilum TaxID=1209926 RepID=A0A1G4BNV9_9PEZI|nr:uncharacterized protein CORC01_01753 [Colletotrichum orchidophilum]OHF02995.1 hypothetical protein CORC01_01753 [Colletotrichum orchidophilum]
MQSTPPSLRGHPPIKSSPPVFTMELQSRECSALSSSGDAPNFCLIKLAAPGLDMDFPSLVPRA